MNKNEERKMGIILGRWSWIFFLEGHWNISTNKYWKDMEKLLIAAK